MNLEGTLPEYPTSLTPTNGRIAKDHVSFQNKHNGHDVESNLLNTLLDALGGACD